MKKLIIAVMMMVFISSFAFAQTIYVDAIGNCLGPEGGEYKHKKVKPGVTYELSIVDGNAVFNTNDGSRMVNVGVMYVQPPRKMSIKTIEKGKKTYVETEGNLYFFFVDDARLNRGGFEVSIRELNR